MVQRADGSVGGRRGRFGPGRAAVVLLTAGLVATVAGCGQASESTAAQTRSTLAADVYAMDTAANPAGLVGRWSISGGPHAGRPMTFHPDGTFQAVLACGEVSGGWQADTPDGQGRAAVLLAEVGFSQACLPANRCSRRSSRPPPCRPAAARRHCEIGPAR